MYFRQITTPNTGATTHTGSMCSSCLTSQCTLEYDNKEVRESCTTGSQCASGSCFNSSCECRKDTDCSDGDVCNTSGSASNECVSGGKSVGETCVVSKQCVSSSCYDFVCECRQDSDCDESEICDHAMPPFVCVFADLPSKSPSVSAKPSVSSSPSISTLPSTSAKPSVSNRPSTSSQTVSPTVSEQPSHSSSPSSADTLSPIHSPTASPSRHPTSTPSLSPKTSSPTTLPSTNPTSSVSNSIEDTLICVWYCTRAHF